MAVPHPMRRVWYARRYMGIRSGACGSPEVPRRGPWICHSPSGSCFSVTEEEVDGRWGLSAHSVATYKKTKKTTRTSDHTHQTKKKQTVKTAGGVPAGYARTSGRGSDDKWKRRTLSLKVSDSIRHEQLSGFIQCQTRHEVAEQTGTVV